MKLPTPFCFGLLLLFTNANFAIGQKHTPPPRPKVEPRIGRDYPHDQDKDRVEDALREKASAAKTRAERERMVEVNLVFTEPVTQEQIDAFEANGGVIRHVYKTISYGWNGQCPLQLVDQLPQLLGPSLILLEEAKVMQVKLYNATQTGRARAIWANNFGGSSSGYDGSTNITIGIIDSGVDESHTDLSGRKKFWYDYASTTNTTALDYHGHGSHVAGIALGSGAAGGSSASTFDFTVWNDLTSAPSGSYYSFPNFTLPATSLTWRSGAKWNGGGSTTLSHGYRTAGTTGNYTTFDSTTGGSILSISGTFTPLTSRVYQPVLVQSSTTNGVTDYTITNRIANYPAIGDGFNKFRGVAPGCNWAGAKVTAGTGGNVASTLVQSALDDMTTGRETYKIKVINLSLSELGSPGLNTTLRQDVNTVVANGIIVVVAAGNDGENGSSDSREIDDPARAAYAITVGASNPTNRLTSYTSVGFTDPGSTSGQEEDYKPDILAPGGSTYYGSIFSVDSNTRDGSLDDLKSNDYFPNVGTSMAAPFVSGAAALVIDALEQNGHAWDFSSSTDPMYVKMLLCATATESNGNRESNTRSPTLQRATTDGTGYPTGKDQYEGYGLINPDAAIEAAVITFTNNTTLASSFGSTVNDRRAWARKVSMTAGQSMSVSLSVPSTGDFDLYLYDNTPSTYGKPVLLTSSTAASTDTDESFLYTPYTNFTGILVVKRVSGSGSFNVTMTSSNNVFASAFDLPVTTAVPYSTGSNTYYFASGSTTGNNSGYSKETGEGTLGSGASGKTAWYDWQCPMTGKIALWVGGSFALEMYTGSSVSALTSVTKQYSGLTSSNVFTVTAGTTYRIAVDGTNNNSGNFTLNWAPVMMSALILTSPSPLILSTESAILNPYPSSIVLSGVTQTPVKLTATLSGVTAENPRRWTVYLLAPNNKGVILMSSAGGDTTQPVTNLTLTFDDSSTNAFSANILTNGTYHPTDVYGFRTNATYSTNLSDLITSTNGAYALRVATTFTTYAAAVSNGWTFNILFNQDPTFSINTTSLGYTENQSATSISSSASISDTDSTDFNNGSLSVQFTANGASEDRLTLLHQGTGSGQIGVSGTVVSYGGTNFGYYTGGTSGSVPLVVYFTNSYATPAAIQQLVTRVAYTNTSDAPSTSTRTVQFSLSDGDGGSASAGKNITVSAANDAPTLTSASTLSGAFEDAAFTISYSTLAAAANEADVDSGTISFRVEGVTSGTLKKNNASVVPGSTLLGSGESWVWTPATNVNGSGIAAFTIKAWDGALASANTVQVNVTVSNVNDAPTVTSISTLTGALEDTEFSISYSTLAAAADDADVDADNISFRIEAISSGTLTKSGANVTAGSTTLSSGETLSWTPAANVNGTNLNAFTVKAYDGTVASSSAVQVKADVSAVNDKPTLVIVTNFLYYIENNPGTIITTNAVLSDIDSSDFDGGSLSIRLSPAGGSDRLSITNEGTGAGQIGISGNAVSYGGTLIGSYSGGFTDSSTLIVSFTNSSATLEAVQKLVSRITFHNVVDSFGTFSRYVIFTVDDGDGATNTAGKYIYPTAVNDAPTLSTIATLAGATQDMAFAISYSMLFTNANIADVDSTGLSFRVQSVSNGTLTKNGASVINGTTLISTNETVVWTPATSGANVNAFAVVAYDGELASTNDVQVTVNVAATNNAPTVSITSPTASDIIKAGSTTTITAIASDLDGGITRVEFYTGTTKLGEATGNPYSIVWTNTFAGTFSLTAKATDTAGALTASAPVIVTVNPYLWYPSYASGFTTLFYGASNAAYTVEFSSDLSSWSHLTNMVITTGPATISDPTNSTHRFYRVVSE